MAREHGLAIGELVGDVEVLGHERELGQRFEEVAVSAVADDPDGPRSDG